MRVPDHVPARMRVVPGSLTRELARGGLADATKLGCRLLFGGADFESVSRTNEMAGGLTVAYLAAIWEQRRDAVIPPARPS